MVSIDSDVPLDVLLARLEDPAFAVRYKALNTLGKRDPAAAARHADAVVAKLEDASAGVRRLALVTLGNLEPVVLAQLSDAVVARLEDANGGVREAALETLRVLEPAVLAQHAGAVVGKLNDRFCLQIFPSGPLYYNVRDEAWKTLLALPLLVTRDIDFKSHIRGRLLGRIAWYRCRLRLRVRRIALYWYALPYRPSGPGHARDMEAWGRMRAE
jgi:hypothetical protein